MLVKKYQDISTFDQARLTEAEVNIRRSLFDRRIEGVMKGGASASEVKKLKKSLARVLTAKRQISLKKDGGLNV